MSAQLSWRLGAVKMFGIFGVDTRTHDWKTEDIAGQWTLFTAKILSMEKALLCSTDYSSVTNVRLWLYRDKCSIPSKINHELKKTQ